jgi:transposase
MPIKDFIIASLNIQPDKIQTLDTVVRDNVLTVYLTLVPQQTECIFCGGPCRSKGLQAQTIKTLDTAGLQTVIIWKRRRYICKDCERSFSEENPLSPPNMSGSYILINEILKDLHNLDLTYQAIAERHHISVSTVQLYADSYVRAPRQYLP